MVWLMVVVIVGALVYVATVVSEYKAYVREIQPRMGRLEREAVNLQKRVAAESLEAACRRDEHRYAVLRDRRTAIDKERGGLEKQRMTVERELNEVRAALDDQRARNRVLEERMEALMN